MKNKDWQNIQYIDNLYCFVFLPLIVNVTFIMTYVCTLKSGTVEYLQDFPYSSVCCSVCSRIWTRGWDQLTSVCVSHHVTSPHIQQAPLHHSRVPAPLPGHQLQEVPLEARIHDWLLLIENKDVSLSLKWPYLPPVVTQIAFFRNETWKLLIVSGVVVRQTD